MRELVEDVVTVPDADIAATVQMLFERLKIVVEPSGATALTALLTGRVALEGGRAGVILSGGNIDAARFAEVVGASSAG